MPRTTPRQDAADALHRAFLLSLIAETEAKIAEELARSDSDSDSDSSSNSSTFSSDSDDDIPDASESYLHHIAELYSRRYWEERGKINKDNSQLQLLLRDWKYNRPEIFRTYCGVTSECFDDILGAVKDDEAFQNNSQNEQTPVEEQLAIALFRFRHYGNAASTMKVALWAGVGYGTV